MRFPRNARILRSQLDVAPFAAVFFLLTIFMVLGALVPTAGLPLRLPEADGLSGLDKPSVSVAIDAGGRYFFNHQMLTETELRLRLREEIQRSPEVTLNVLADQSVPYGRFVRLTLLAREAGFRDAHLATLSRPINRSARTVPQ